VASTATLGPIILSDVLPEGTLAKTEFFGAVLGMIRVETVDAAIELVNHSAFGNMACVFTSSGAAACKFRDEAEAGNIGISIGATAPMAAFPFSGWKDSLFGTLHGQARRALEFFAQAKIVVERSPKEWSRQF
jgi:malonate-semialdehyde dehydrogenase (acetylating)/methylmalonate-semialdehyde dehydrogenase